jgi:hypothetical protein
MTVLSCSISDDIFTIITNFMSDDITSIIKLIKTKKNIKDYISSEINLEEKKQEYIDIRNCITLEKNIKMYYLHNYKKEFIFDTKELCYDIIEYENKTELLENNMNNAKRIINKYMKLVYSKNCIKHFKKHIIDNYENCNKGGIFNSYMLEKVSNDTAVRLYILILKILKDHSLNDNILTENISFLHDNIVFEKEEEHLLTWIKEGIDFHVNDYIS